MTKSERVYVKAAVAALGKAIGSTRAQAKELELSVLDERRLWKEVLIMVANGGGKMK